MKRWLSLLLVIVMVMSLLCGCGKQNDEGKEDVNPAASGEEAQALKVLIIGNGHSQDSFWHLNEIIATHGIPEGFTYEANEITQVILGVMDYAGCYMYQHASFAKNNSPVYTYYKSSYGMDGEETSWVTTQDVDMKSVLTEEKWDIVVLQEMNMDKGIALDSYSTDTQSMINHVKETLGYAPDFRWNMVWPNAEIPILDGQEYKDKEWIYATANPGGTWEYRMKEYFNNDAQTQHNMMVAYVDNYITGRYGITGDKIVSTGSAVMYALNNLTLSGDAYSYLANEQFIFRDYTHLTDIGRVMVAYLWYAELFDLEQVEEIQYAEIAYDLQVVKTEDESAITLTDTQKAHIQEAVNATLADRRCAYTAH